MFYFNRSSKDNAGANKDRVAGLNNSNNYTTVRKPHKNKSKSKPRSVADKPKKLISKPLKIVQPKPDTTPGNDKIRYHRLSEAHAAILAKSSAAIVTIETYDSEHEQLAKGTGFL